MCICERSMKVEAALCLIERSGERVPSATEARPALLEDAARAVARDKVAVNMNNDCTSLPSADESFCKHFRYSCRCFMRLETRKGGIEANMQLSACVAFRSERGDVAWSCRLSGWRLRVRQSFSRDIGRNCHSRVLLIARLYAAWP